MREYSVKADVRGTYHHVVFGAIEFEFPAGRIQPKNELEEIVLEEQLVPSGTAELTRADEPRSWGGEVSALVADARAGQGVSVGNDVADQKPQRRRRPKSKSKPVDDTETEPQTTVDAPAAEEA